MKSRPELYELIQKSIAEFNALPLEPQEVELRAQRESWVRGEMALGEWERSITKAFTPAPVAPPCDCPAERYRHALAQIGRYSPCSIAQGYVDEALFASARAKGETS